MLHGYTQSGHTFNMKTKALEKTLRKTFAPTGGVELVYPTGPLKIRPADIPGFLNPDGEAGSQKNGSADKAVQDPDFWGWWIRRGDAEPFIYEGMEAGLATVADQLKNYGPFDGVLGFSQGGALAGMVASLLEPGRVDAFDTKQAVGSMPFPPSFLSYDSMGNEIADQPIHPPLRFAVSYSGFGASAHPLYQAFYEPRIRTPMLHFLGSMDTVVEERRSLRLVEATWEGEGRGGKRVVRHPGGHFLPASQKACVGALTEFLKETMGWEEADGGGERSGKGVGGKEERAEDMDVPF